MLVDIPLDELKVYKPSQNRKPDFLKFWKETKKISSREPLNRKIKKIEYIFPGIRAHKIYYDGFKKARICGYYLLPKEKGIYPAIVFFHGYGDNKQKINLYLKWVLMGYAVLAIDIRGQNGESIDNKYYPGPSAIGYMTKGIFSKDDYYYRGVYIDCIRAIDFLQSEKEIDMRRICLNGVSQGGGIALAIAGLDSRPKLVIADIPYLCHFKRAIEWAEDFKNVTYLEFTNILRKFPEREDEMYSTLSYFDNLNLCNHIKAKTIITVGMKDTVCPPSTIFAVYNHIKADKKIEIMPFFDHGWEAVLNFDEKRLEYILKFL